MKQDVAGRQAARPARGRQVVGVLIVACLGAGCTAPDEAAAPDAPAWFHDATAAAGIAMQHARAQTVRYWFPEIMSGGACWIDADGDGWLDLYIVQGGDLDPATPGRPGNRLYRNNGGTFEDVTARAGVGDDGYGMGCTVGDYDGDGDDDLYVTNVGPNRLYRNNGGGAFEDATDQAGVGHDGWGASAALADYDGDGLLDLFVVNYVGWRPDQEQECFAGGNARDYCQPENYSAPAQDVLYRNEGGPDPTFTDVTVAAGLDHAKGNGLGVAVADFNGDGRLDFYVTNDGNPNQLWINGGDGTFTDEALRSGSAVNRQGMAEAGMGVAAVDYDQDGDLDLYMTHLRDETNTLYLNGGGALFEDATIRAGLATPSIPYTGFGLGFGDFSNDGLLDLFVANGRVGQTLAPLGDDPFGEPNQLFEGQPDGRLTPVEHWGDGGARTTRAAAVADYDNDGDLDLALVNNGGPVQLLQNVRGDALPSIQFYVLDRRGREALGARLRVTAGGRAQWRMVQRTYSYLASHDPRVHVGLGPAADAEGVTVFWLDGTVEAFGALAGGAVHVLRQGQGEAGPPGGS